MERAHFSAVTGRLSVIGIGRCDRCHTRKADRSAITRQPRHVGSDPLLAAFTERFNQATPSAGQNVIL
jgi:hypothetical protein